MLPASQFMIEPIERGSHPLESLLMPDGRVSIGVPGPRAPPGSRTTWRTCWPTAGITCVGAPAGRTSSAWRQPASGALGW